MSGIITKLKPRLWATIKNWSRENAQNVEIEASDFSEERVNIIFEGKSCSVDIRDLLEAVRQLQIVRVHGKVAEHRYRKQTVKMQLPKERHIS